MREREADFVPLRAFGKLPLARGWIEAGTGSPEGSLVKQWFLAGRQTMLEEVPEDQDRRILERRGRYFILQSRAVPDLVVGLAAPSRDAARPSRTAPFALFFALPRRPYEKRWGFLPMLLRETWDILEEAWEAVTAAVEEEDLLDEVRGWRVPLPQLRGGAEDAYRERLQRRADDLVRRMEQPWREFLAERLRQVGRELGRGWFQSPSVLVELPPAESLEDAAFAAAFWMEVIDRQVGRWRRRRPSVFLPRFEGEGGEERLPLLAYGELGPAAYAAALGTETPAGVHRLHGPGGSSPGPPGDADVPSYRELVRPW